MSIIEIIKKKKNGQVLSQEDFDSFVKLYKNNEMPDYQVSALFMAICLQGLNTKEMVAFIIALVGDNVQINRKSDVLSYFSFGGIGNKIGLALIPLLASLDIKIKQICYSKDAEITDCKKLESIPNIFLEYNDEKSGNMVEEFGGYFLEKKSDDIFEKFDNIQRKTGLSSSIDLNTVFILAKLLLSQSASVLLQLNYGNNITLNVSEDMITLANKLIKVAGYFNLDLTVALISNEVPIGKFIGTSLEIIEVIEFLKGNSVDKSFSQAIFEIATLILLNYGNYSTEKQITAYIKDAISSGKALDTFRKMISACGGNVEVIENYDKFKLPLYKIECKSKKSGYVHSINSNLILEAMNSLYSLEHLDFSAGIHLNKKVGEYINNDEILYTIYSNSNEFALHAQKVCDKAYSINENKVSYENLIYKIIRDNEEYNV